MGPDTPSRGAPDGGDERASPDGSPSVPAGRLESIIRRATELQFAEGEGGRELLSEEEVLRIGREVGLEPRHVRRALAESHARDLLPDEPADEGLLRRVAGGAVVRASRVVPGDLAEVQRRVEQHLESRQSLRAVRRRRGRSVWEPSEGLVDKMQRALDVAGRGYELAEARRVEVAVAQLEEGRSLVTLTADLRNVRREQAVAWGSVSAGGFSGVGVLLAVATGMPWFLAVPAALAGAAATTSLGVGRTLDRRRDRVRTATEGLLDRLETGTLEEDEGPGWRRILG